MHRFISRTLWMAALLALSPNLALISAEETDTPVQIRQTDKGIDFTVGDRLVARYHVNKKVAKPYFWPVNAPNGQPITRGWPMTDAPKGGTTDHVHQKSMWFCHGDVVVEGLTPKTKIKRVDGFDFWSENKGAGKIVCVKVDKPVIKGQQGTLKTWNEWRTPEGVKVLDEERTIHFYNFGESQLLVFDIDLTASVGDTTFADTKEGSMGIRIRDDIMEKQGGTLFNAMGQNRAVQMWGRPSDWVDYSGTFKYATKSSDALQKATAGLAVFDDPTNKPRACWHARNYGLLAANPFARGRSGFPAMKGRTDLLTVKKGDHLKLRYGVYLHLGDAKKGKVAEAYKRFVELGK